MGAAGVRSSGGELDEHDVEAVWAAAMDPRRSARPAMFVPLAKRLAAERPDRAREGVPAEEAGQLAFDLAA
jgi:hypothetical protein